VRASRQNVGQATVYDEDIRAVGSDLLGNGTLNQQLNDTVGFDCSLLSTTISASLQTEKAIYFATLSALFLVK